VHAIIRKWTDRTNPLSFGTSMKAGGGTIYNPILWKEVSHALTFLATSVPDRSSLGSGSVYPASFASATISLKVRVPLKLLKI